MDSIDTIILNALTLLVTGNTELWSIIGISFSLSTTAIFIAVLPATLSGFFLAYSRFPGRRLLIALFNTLLSVPAVAVGLVFYILLSRQGPLGDWRLLFTPSAIVLGQIALSFPILVAMTHSAFQSIDIRAWETARTLGINPIKAFYLMVREVRFGILGAVVAGYSRIIAEVGVSMMLGGNILHYTRNIPTGIALETSKGEFAQGIALGVVLVLLSFFLVTALHYFQGKGQVK